MKEFQFISDGLNEPIFHKQSFDADVSDSIQITVREGESMTFIMDITSVGTISRMGTVNITVEKNATLHFVSFQDLNQESTNQESIQTNVADHATIFYYIGQFGSKKTRLDLVTNLTGKESQSEVRSVYYTDNKQHIDMYIENCYDAPNVSGQMLINGASMDHSRGSVEGMIRITDKGQGTDSYLKQNTLMLDKTVRTDSIPSLEIKANEVKAGHGSAISKVSENDLFYLQSRGIDKIKSRKMYVDGFLQSLAGEFEGIEYVGERTKELVALK